MFVKTKFNLCFSFNQDITRPKILKLHFKHSSGFVIYDRKFAAGRGSAYWLFTKCRSSPKHLLKYLQENTDITFSVCGQLGHSTMQTAPERFFIPHPGGNLDLRFTAKQKSFSFIIKQSVELKETQLFDSTGASFDGKPTIQQQKFLSNYFFRFGW